MLGISGAVQQPNIRFSEDVEVPATQWESGAESFSLVLRTRAHFNRVRVRVSCAGSSDDPAGQLTRCQLGQIVIPTCSHVWVTVQPECHQTCSMPSRRIWAPDDGVVPAGSRAGRLEVVSDVGRVAVLVVNIADDDSEVWTGSLENIEGTPRDNGGSATDEVEDWGSAASEAGSHIAEEESTPDVLDADEARMTGPIIRAAFQSILDGVAAHVARQVRGWKVLLLLPRMLLRRPPRGGKVSKEKLTERLENFRNGRWIDLVRDSEEIGDQAVTAARRRRGRKGDDVESCAARTLFLTQSGELSSARQALEGAEVAPANLATLGALTDTTRRPAVPREPLPTSFQVRCGSIVQEFAFSKKGAAGGPSGMTTEHLQPLLCNPRDLHAFFLVCEQLARVEVPAEVVRWIKLGRMTALRKPEGGVWGIVAGDVIRRLVSRTVAQQWGPAVERFSALFQYALSTRAGSECIAHVLQALSELNPQCKVMSIDGISAYDLIARKAMLEGLVDVAGGEQVLQHVRLFYGIPVRVHVGG